MVAIFSFPQYSEPEVELCIWETYHAGVSLR